MIISILARPWIFYLELENQNSGFIFGIISVILGEKSCFSEKNFSFIRFFDMIESCSHVAILNSMQFMTNYKEKIKIGFIERVIAHVYHVTCLSVELANKVAPLKWNNDSNNLSSCMTNTQSNGP